MLDPGQDAPARDALAQEARAQIEAGGTLKHENNWGLRKMAYEIDQRNEADYRWFRFEAPTELLEQLDHNLKIADGVLRFRIFKVDPDAPVMVPPATAAPGPGASRERPAGPPRPAPAPRLPPSRPLPSPPPRRLRSRRRGRAAEPEPEPAAAEAEPRPSPPRPSRAEAPAAAQPSTAPSPLFAADSAPRGGESRRLRS